MNKHWFKLKTYPGAACCPLCRLPETEGQFSSECHCWDTDTTVVTEAQQNQPPAPEAEPTIELMIERLR